MSRDPRIDAYIERAQPFARPILEKVRERVHAMLADVEETVKWSMPAYTVGGKILLITAAFKHHAALNFWRGQELRADSANADAMGQFGKIASVDDLPSDRELDSLIREAADISRIAPTARKAKHSPKPPPEMPPDFAKALSRSPTAKAVLDGFPPSARRDYIECVSDAKQHSTRHKRIATAVEWLSQGKRRNWQYQR